MKLLATIREKDVNPEREQLADEAHPNFRQAVRVVLFDGEGNIALNHYPPHGTFTEDAYCLPGGGVDEGETLIEALAREALEETGCGIKDIAEVGYTIEYMKMYSGKQESYVFTANLDGDKGEPSFTESEKRDGMRVVWFPLNEAIGLTKKCADKSFESYRAVVVLEEIKNLS